MKTYYRVQADIDLDAIYKNAENAKKLTKPGTKFMAIVKAEHMVMVQYPSLKY